MNAFYSVNKQLILTECVCDCLPVILKGLKFKFFFDFFSFRPLNQSRTVLDMKLKIDKS